MRLISWIHAGCSGTWRNDLRKGSSVSSDCFCRDEWFTVPVEYAAELAHAAERAQREFVLHP